LHQTKKKTCARSNLKPNSPQVEVKREGNESWKLLTNLLLNFRLRMMNWKFDLARYFLSKCLLFVDRWKCTSPRKRNLQLPKIRLEKHNLSSLGVFYRERFICCFLKDHKFRKFAPNIRDNRRTQIVQDWSPFNSRVSVDYSRWKLTRRREGEARIPMIRNNCQNLGKISCDRRWRAEGQSIDMIDSDGGHQRPNDSISEPSRIPWSFEYPYVRLERWAADRCRGPKVRNGKKRNRRETNVYTDI